MLGTACLLGACSEDRPDFPEAPDRIPPLELSADTERIGPEVRIDTASVRFRVPRGWRLLDSTAAHRVQQSIVVGSDSVHTRPLRSYGEQNTSSFLVVSALRIVASAPEESGAVYRRILDNRYPDVRLDTLQRERIGRVLGFVITSRRFVHHKLVFGASPSRMLQFDYVVPRVHYSRMLPAIEASAGSIRPLERK